MAYSGIIVYKRRVMWCECDILVCVVAARWSSYKIACILGILQHGGNCLEADRIFHGRHVRT